MGKIRLNIIFKGNSSSISLPVNLGSKTDKVILWRNSCTTIIRKTLKNNSNEGQSLPESEAQHRQCFQLQSWSVNRVQYKESPETAPTRAKCLVTIQSQQAGKIKVIPNIPFTEMSTTWV